MNTKKLKNLKYNAENFFLTDEHGNETAYKLLNTLNYKDDWFIILLPITKLNLHGDSEYSYEPIVLKIDGCNEYGTQSYTSINDPLLSEQILNKC